MASGQLASILGRLRRAVGLAGEGNRADGLLLERFARHGDEAAFTLLVQKHGAMVLGVCERVLGDVHEAEDAFQATFLILARKALAIRKSASVGSWLHGVALRVARKMKAAAARHRLHERQVEVVAEDDPPADAARRELRPLLDEELGRLPESYRAPLVLCYLEGKTNAEAARELGWPRGTVSGRLARARDLLRGRLQRRGITLSSGLLVALLTECARAVPIALVGSTVKAAAVFAAGNAAAAGAISPPAAAAAEGVMQAMLVTKMKFATAVLLVVGAFGTGAGVLAQRAGPGRQTVPADPAARPAPEQPDPSPDEAKKLREQVDALQKKLREAEQQLRALRDEATKQRDVAEQQRRVADEARAQAEKALQDALVERRRAEAAQRLAKDAEAAAVVRLAEAVSTRNLTVIGLALRKYNEHHGTLPAAALHSKDGKPLLSWRVALLPYLGEEKLHDQFKLDEPWDSPHNKRLVARMPKVFALANSTPEKGQTFYRVFHGQGAAFEGKQGVKLASFVDGTANTAVVVEASTSS
ncbi:MAG TPA: sigma-70 family RNA polymerase sigma factor, partial [Gemmataceae bacterium]|nr:sigma-70 family RNA polymerase sigma factor [Gemmataceae bacterium]